MMVPVDTVERRGPGRPQRHDDGEILSAALAAFASVGYDAMSIRSLGRQLGLSHGALNQRFTSKEHLFYAALDHGFADLTASIARHTPSPPPSTGREVLREGIRTFLLASAERPQIMRLMNTLGMIPSARLDYVFEHHISPIIEPLRAATAEPGASAHISTREMFFLVAHGAAAAFSLQALADHFNDTDGHLDPEQHAARMADVLVRTLDP